ncbi:hypothetical protein K461DRAFT_316637 [Myriangium duriaei CBS 260.36]|uniref:Uncharacterized protein n=1 Tax=Myriangium duriaei CBS 260.36 TaxID=1168546 RepID=A0A9P4IPJ7_9PEZI|nr:hypothetical protein K461DRAFT_316637 [Myriangium duriaei CBS 260.36]
MSDRSNALITASKTVDVREGAVSDTGGEECKPIAEPVSRAALGEAEQKLSIIVQEKRGLSKGTPAAIPSHGVLVYEPEYTRSTRDYACIDSLVVHYSGLTEFVSRDIARGHPATTAARLRARMMTAVQNRFY